MSPADETSPRYQVLGTNPPRVDALDKVTGRAVYAADLRLPGRLYGAVLRSPHAHARIVSMDTAAARALPGVRAVITAADLDGGARAAAELNRSQRYGRENILASAKVLYYGHALAAVAADSPNAAHEALKLVKVVYEPLPPVMEARRAMRADAPVLLPDLRTDEFGQSGGQPTNVALHIQLKLGDVEQGFARSAVVVEREFTTATIHQGYIEPHSATAVWNLDGQITVWCSIQGAFQLRDQVAEILQVPIARIRVIPLEIGGGFGGKNTAYLEPLAALLSRACGGRPVKMTMSRAEVLAATGPAPGSVVRVKMGADSQGNLTAAQAWLAYEAGAFPGSFIDGGVNGIFSAYRIENVLVDGYDVVVNKPRNQAYRAPGGPNAIFASESVVEELAGKLGIDPLEFRLRNVVHEGDRRADGSRYKRIGFAETLLAARDSAHYRAPLPGPHAGRGVACAAWGNYGGASSVSASLNPDGSLSLVTGSVDLASGRLAASMQLAETLGIPVESIRAVVGDTDQVGFTEGTYGSRTTFATGLAVFELGSSLIDIFMRRAAAHWGVESDQVSYAQGSLIYQDRTLSLQQLGNLTYQLGPVSASAAVHAGQWGPTFAVHIVDAAVDPETGKVDLLRYTAVQDVGTAVTPAYLEGQLQGGVTQGAGWALNEEYVYDQSGRLLNASLLDYRMPVCLDMPPIETILVEVPSPTHPFGVRGAGEMPIVPPPAAIANAIYHAAGIRMQDLPMSPPRILGALLAKAVQG
jgi:CO/xanthine dehydrogenase Mo-binding subunit